MKITIYTFLAILFLTATAAAQNAVSSPETGSAARIEKPLVASLDVTTFDAPASEKPTAAKRQTDEFKYVRPNSKQRLNRFGRDLVSPFGFVSAAFSAGINTASNEPPEWKKDGSGFARRFASKIGERTISRTVIYGLDEAFRLDSHFYRKGKGASFNKRLANALLSNVTARTASGKRVVGVPRIVGIYTGGVVASETWYPKRLGYKDGLRQGTISLGVGFGVNILREFLFK